MTRNNPTPLAAALAAAALIATAAPGAHAERMNAGAPQWTADGQLVLPSGYHEWVFLGAPLTPHGLNDGKAGFPEYHNVYVQPQVLRAYRQTGQWPEGTVLLKELQLTRPGTHADGSGNEASGRGYFPGARNGIDIAVKDSKRFRATHGWGYFNFGHHAPPYAQSAAAAPKEACADCHASNATADMVFSKFYAPILQAH